MLFDNQLVRARAAASHSPFSLKNSVALENCNPQIAAVVAPSGRLNLYTRSGNYRRPATDRLRCSKRIRRNNCMRKIDLDQIHWAPLLIDSAAGAPGLRSPDPPVSASGPGHPHPPDTPVRGHTGAAHKHSMVGLQICGCTRNMQTESRGQIVQTHSPNRGYTQRKTSLSLQTLRT